MSYSARIASTFAFGIVAVAVFLGVGLKAQTGFPNPYRTNYNWEIQGRQIGTPSGIRADPDGQHLWILDRCGENGCADSDLDPIIEVTMDGKIVKTFGKHMFGFPHGFHIDKENNIWVTDGGAIGDRRGEAGFKKGIGHQVWKFDHDGKVLMKLGVAGVGGADETHFNGPTAVVVAPNGDLWVTDGHGGSMTGPNKDNMFTSRGGNNRLVHLSKDGKFIKAYGGGIGSEGQGPLQFNDPHDMDIDHNGIIYVADRGNMRIQLIDSKDGRFVSQWRQFGKPSAIIIVGNTIFVADGMSNDFWNPGFERGVRIGDIRDGYVRAFVPDVQIFRQSGTEFIGVDAKWSIYAGSASRLGIYKHELYRPLFFTP
jgi:sugar lactone lactonase YvrE